VAAPSGGPGAEGPGGLRVGLFRGLGLPGEIEVLAHLPARAPSADSFRSLARRFNPQGEDGVGD